jgi:ComF family protein
MAIRVDRCFDLLCGLLLPPRCVLCGSPGQRPCQDLCGPCAASLPTVPAPVLVGEPPVDHWFVPYSYAFPVDHLVHRLKYQRQLAIGRVLGTLLARAATASRLHGDVDVIVPVPLHPDRHAERGFNQSAEIARRAALELGCRLEEGAVRRVRNTPRQVGLRPTERRANIVGAFAAIGDQHGRRVVVLDDVITTGVTAGEVARALKDAGAASIDVWGVARADGPSRASTAMR